MPTFISRDSFARVDTVRRRAPSHHATCANCDRPAKWQYGFQPDSLGGRVSWDQRSFCCISCRREYYHE